MRWRGKPRDGGRNREWPLSAESRRKRDREALKAIGRDLQALLEELRLLALDGTATPEVPRRLITGTGYSAR